MTREEAIDKAQIIDFQGGYTIELVTKIYDDFESRTCDSCKHWIYDEDNYNGECGHAVDDGTDSFSSRLGTSATEGDFSCNKWESKDG